MELEELLLIKPTGGKIAGTRCMCVLCGLSCAIFSPVHIAGNTGPMRNRTSRRTSRYLRNWRGVHGVRVVYASVLPVHNYTIARISSPQARILALNDWLKDYCSKNNIVYLDYFVGAGRGHAEEGRPMTVASERGRFQDHGAAGRGGDSESFKITFPPRRAEFSAGWHKSCLLLPSSHL